MLNPKCLKCQKYQDRCMGDDIDVEDYQCGDIDELACFILFEDGQEFKSYLDWPNDDDDT